MKRREALQAKDGNRTPRALYARDFLIGVQDLTRQGALRFRRAGTDTFLGNEKMAPPPVIILRETARRTGIASADISLTAGAFSAHAEFRASSGRP